MIRIYAVVSVIVRHRRPGGMSAGKAGPRDQAKAKHRSPPGMQPMVAAPTSYAMCKYVHGGSIFPAARMRKSA
jgi:hypothetical protein